MSFDWRDTARTDIVRVWSVQPSTLETIGEVTGIDLAASSLSAGYFTDTRTSGKLAIFGNGPAKNQWVRITHEIPEWNFKETLGTYLVKDERFERDHGEWKRTLELQSTLYGLSTNLAHQPWALSEGASCLNAIRQLLKSCGSKYVESNPADAAVTQTFVMESGKSQLERLYDLCSRSGNRLDCNRNGYVSVSHYVNPAIKPACFTFDLADPRGIVEDKLTMNDTSLTRPTESVVRYKWTEGHESKKKGTHKTEKEAIGTAYAGGSQSADSRGFVVTDWTDVTDEHHEDLNELAKRSLARLSPDRIEWTLNTTYLPIWEGDVVNLVLKDGPVGYSGTRKCVVKSIDIDLRYCAMNLTLKETGSPDEDGDG